MTGQLDMNRHHGDISRKSRSECIELSATNMTQENNEY